MSYREKNECAVGSACSGESGKICKKIDHILSQVPDMNMAENDVYDDEGNVYEVVAFQRSGKEVSNKVIYKKQPDASGLHEFKCCYHPIFDIPCVHIVTFLQRLSNGSYDFGTVPQSHQLLHPHHSAKRLSDRYQFPHTPVDYGDLDVFYIAVLPGSVSIRPGRPREPWIENVHLLVLFLGIAESHKTRN